MRREACIVLAAPPTCTTSDSSGSWRWPPVWRRCHGTGTARDGAGQTSAGAGRSSRSRPNGKTDKRGGGGGTKLPQEYDCSSSSDRDDSKGLSGSEESSSDGDAPLLSTKTRSAPPGRRLTNVRAELTGRKVLVPAAEWPDEEWDGAGWLGTVQVVARDLSSVKVRVDGHTYIFPMESVLQWQWRRLVRVYDLDIALYSTSQALIIARLHSARLGSSVGGAFYQFGVRFFTRAIEQPSAVTAMGAR
eukprot:scaffold23448_cov133-Isochrysis_galbana.AAC.1